jgi:hypothetical protein
MRPRHAEGGAERRARGLRRAAGMRPLPVRRRIAGSFPVRLGAGIALEGALPAVIRS